MLVGLSGDAARDKSLHHRLRYYNCRRPARGRLSLPALLQSYSDYQVRRLETRDNVGFILIFQAIPAVENNHNISLLWNLRIQLSF